MTFGLHEAQKKHRLIDGDILLLGFWQAFEGGKKTLEQQQIHATLVTRRYAIIYMVQLCPFQGIR